MYRGCACLLCFFVLITVYKPGSGNLFTEDGILTYQMGEVRTLTATWTTVITLKPPAEPRVEAWMQLLQDRIHELEVKGAVGRQEVLEWREYIRFLRYDLSTAYPEPIHVRTKRTKRAPFDFIGSLSRVLFGTATQAQIAALTKVVMDTQKGVLAMAHHNTEMISILNQTRMYIRENRFDINILQGETDLIIEQVNNILVRLQSFDRAIHKIHIRRRIDLLLDTVYRAINVYHRLSETFHRQRLQLERGFLTDEIMPISYLKAVLSKLEEKGHNCAPTRWYYQFGKIQLLLDTDEELVYQTVLPGLSDTKYLRYQLQYFPVPMGTEFLRKIVGRQNIVIDSISSGSFEPFHCMGERPTVCAATVESTTPTCESNILTGRSPEGCDVQITRKGNSSCGVYRESSQLATVVLIPYTTEETTLRCPGQHPVRSVYTQPTRLDLEVGCMLESQTWRIKSVEQGHSQFEIPTPKILALPGFNLSFPNIKKTQLLEELELVQRMEVPLLALAGTEEEGFLLNPQVKKWGVIIGIPGAMIMCVLMVFMLVRRAQQKYPMKRCDWRHWYMLCKKGKRPTQRKGATPMTKSSSLPNVMRLEIRGEGDMEAAMPLQSANPFGKAPVRKPYMEVSQMSKN